MNTIYDDATVDGWLALCIAILRGVPQQEAFRMLENPSIRRKWHEDDYMEIECLLEQGMSWTQIGELMKAERTTVLNQYKRWKRINGK